MFIVCVGVCVYLGCLCELLSDPHKSSDVVGVSKIFEKNARLSAALCNAHLSVPGRHRMPAASVCPVSIPTTTYSTPWARATPDSWGTRSALLCDRQLHKF